MSNPIVNFFQRIFHWFSSPQGQATAKAIEQAAIDAEPVVEAIAAMVPSRTFQLIAAAYEKYAVPFAMTEVQLSIPSDATTGQSDSIKAQQGLALRDLATSILEKNHQGVSANVLNTAVELAVAHIKSK